MKSRTAIRYGFFLFFVSMFMLSVGQGCPDDSSGNGGTPGGITPPDGDNGNGDEPPPTTLTVTTVFDVQDEQLVRLSDDSFWRVNVGARPFLQEGDAVEADTFFLTDADSGTEYTATRLGLVVYSSSIAQITPNAQEVELVNGTRWEIFAEDQPMVTIWLPLDNVLVTQQQDGDYFLIHVVDGEVAQALRT
jgi:hypothetical protein